MKPEFHLQAKAEVITSVDKQDDHRWEVSLRVLGIVDAIAAGHYLLFLGPGLNDYLTAAGEGVVAITGTVSSERRKFGSEVKLLLTANSMGHASRLGRLVLDYANLQMQSWGWKPNIVETIH